MSKWTRTLALFLALAMLTLAGCGAGKNTAPTDTKQPTPTVDPVKPPTPVTLNMWIMPNSGQSEQDMLDTLKPFLDKNTHITVKVTVLDWGSAWPKITTAATSGEGPDIMQLGTTWVPAIAAMDALEPVTNKVADVGGKDAFYPASWNTTGIAGKPDVYAIPWFVDARAVFYRTDVFQKAGVDPKEAFKTWDSFRKALEKVNNTEIDGKKIAAVGFPGKNDWNVAHNVFPWIWAAGGSEFSADLKSSAINSDAAVEGMMFYTGLARDGLAPKAVLEKNTADAEAMFGNGDFAVLFGGPWLVRSYMTPNDKGGNMDAIAAKHYAVAPMPAGPQGQFTFFGGSNLSVFKHSKAKNEAWDVIKYLSTKEAQVTYARFSGMLPGLKAAETDMKALSPNYNAFYEAAKYGRSYPSIPAWGPVEGVLVKHVGIIWDVTAGVSGTYSKAEIKKNLDNAAKEVDNLLKQQ